MASDKEKIIVDTIERSLRNFDLGDIKALCAAKVEVDMTMAGFILCVCFIEHICTFMFGGKKVGKKEFQQFVSTYLDQRYDAKSLREDLRDSLVHNYTLGDCYVLTRRSSVHLASHANPPSHIALDLDSFVEELEHAFEQYIVDVRANKNDLWKMAIKAFNSPHGDPKKKRRKGIIDYHLS